jgi:hypothetical protein
MYHRGTKFNQAGDRRLLQVFEVFPTKDTYETHVHKLITVKSNDSTLIKVSGKILFVISKVPVIIDSINAAHFILVYNNLQYKVSLMDFSPDEKKDKYVTYEPGIRKSIDELTKNEELNVNIICDNTTKVVSTSNYYLHLFLLFVLLVVGLYFIVKYAPFMLSGKPIRKYLNLRRIAPMKK